MADTLSKLMREAPKYTIAILTAGGKAPNILINAIVAHFPDVIIIQEQPETKKTLLVRRARKIGWFKVAGQFPVMVAMKLLKPLVKKRFSEIETDWRVSMLEPQGVKLHSIASANDGSLPDIINREKVDLLFVIGARMLAAKTLEQIQCTIINFHAGMTPDYRGLNGGYWAMVDGKPDRYGGTVHLVDAGVDTGAVIASHICKPDKRDMLFTHQHAITAQCVPMCRQAIETVMNGTAKPHIPSGKSQQHYHPTVWQWIATGISRGTW